MYNHFRTLLVNLPGPTSTPRRYDDGPGAEAVPAGFRPVPLPRPLAAVRAALFGRDPDRALADYRAWQLMTAVHATELGEYVTALDPRLTYDVGPAADHPYADPATFAPRCADPALAFSGGPAAPDDLGRCAYAFELTLADGAVAVDFLHAPEQARVYAVSFSGGRSTPVPLGDTGYGVTVPDAAPAVWTVAGLLRPALGLPELAGRLSGSGAALDEVFGRDGEPYKTFRNLWERNPELPYRLAGAVCALVYRTEEARTGAPTSGVRGR